MRSLRWFLLLGILLCARALPAAEVEVDTDLILREVYAKDLIITFGEIEQFKQLAVGILSTTAEATPKSYSMYWSRVGAGLKTEHFERAIARHYAASFTSDELRHLTTLFKPPAMRGLVYWARMMAEKQMTPEQQAQEVERLRKQYGDQTVLPFADLLNSALGRQLIATQASARELRVKEAIAALADSTERAGAVP